LIAILTAHGVDHQTQFATAQPAITASNGYAVTAGNNSTEKNNPQPPIAKVGIFLYKFKMGESSRK